jgi:hypothetical protein
MKKGFLFGCMTFVLMGVAMPQASDAYFTTAQSAMMLEDGKGVLYSVTYEFGTEKYDLYMPIVPERNGAREEQVRTMTYAFVDEDDQESAMGESVGVVVSDAEIRDGYYFVPKGEAKRFTLITLLRLPQTLVYEPFDLSLLVTNLPFDMKAKDAEVAAQLNPSELQYYRTPAIKN